MVVAIIHFYTHPQLQMNAGMRMGLAIPNHPLAFKLQLIICSSIFRFKETGLIVIIFGLFPTADVKCYPPVSEPAVKYTG